MKLQAESITNTGDQSPRRRHAFQILAVCMVAVVSLIAIGSMHTAGVLAADKLAAHKPAAEKPAAPMPGETSETLLAAATDRDDGEPVTVSKPEPVDPAVEQAAKAHAAFVKHPEIAALLKDGVPLNRDGTVLLDKTAGRLVLKSEVVLREGALEMLLCRARTKTHESVLAVDSQAYTIHAGLLALGLKPGSVVTRESPASGPKTDVLLRWIDAQGALQSAPAQSWIRRATRRFFVATLDALPAGIKIPKTSELKYDAKLKELSWYGHMTETQRDELLALSNDDRFQKCIRQFFADTQYQPLSDTWVFAGSSFYVAPENGTRTYLAEDGDLITVANFPSSMLDLPVTSSDSTASLLFEAYTERIPPVGTPVLLLLQPAPAAAAAPEKSP